MLRIGIIGCGKIAQFRHIPEYAANPDAELAGFFDLNQARAEAVAAPFGGRVYDSWQALVADPAIDAVSICTANVSHAEIAIGALEAGKHVLLEKPMASTLAECEAVVQAVEASGKLLMIDLNQRFLAAHELARQLLADGAIGRLVAFRTVFGHGGPETWSIDPGAGTWFFDPRFTTLGAMGDLGVHKTDIIHFLTGERVVEVTGRVATLEKRGPDGELIGVDDNAWAIYRLSGGAVGTMHASWTFHGFEDNSTILYGTDGIISVFTDPDYQVIISKPGAEPDRRQVGAIQTNDDQTASGAIDDFVAAVVDGGPSPVSAVEALASMRAVFAALESSSTGRPVAIPENEG
jgi:predicted dehydrogenase